MTPAWVNEAMFYHIYPLGLLGAPTFTDFSAGVEPRLEQLHEWIDHIVSLGMTGVYLGPVFESTEHGYNTADYLRVDRRLGDNAALKSLIQAMKARGLRVIVDGVFNHVGRDFWAFRDIQTHGRASAYLDWFDTIDFERTSPYGDSFAYEGWEGHYDLVKLNQDHPALRQHLFEAISLWIREFDLDGLRLSGVDTYTRDFMLALATHCRSLKPDFWLVGEVGSGDYRAWINPSMLDSAADVEVQRALIKSHAENDYHYIAEALTQKFGENGIYQDVRFYNFVDNHDNPRAASTVKHPEQLISLYLLLFTLPGVPSIYYGSEWALGGERIDEADNAANENVDTPLRPHIRFSDTVDFPNQTLKTHIARFATLRRKIPALREGDYRLLKVSAQQFIFSRTHEGIHILVGVNAADSVETFSLQVASSAYVDVLTGETMRATDKALTFSLPPKGWRVLRGI